LRCRQPIMEGLTAGSAVPPQVRLVFCKDSPQLTLPREKFEDSEGLTPLPVNDD
jgi:hypothetical protein